MPRQAARGARRPAFGATAATSCRGLLAAVLVAGWLIVPIGASGVASGTPGASQTPSLPSLNAPVNDFAHVIDADAAREIDARIRALQAASGDAVVVATVPTLEPFGSIEEYAV
ncbi:MAG TPA: TPM domain-containing protein, partial [Vicinamibacterales bacterium]